MSESDDTDILLLIPPNFFLVDDKSNENLPGEFHLHNNYCPHTFHSNVGLMSDHQSELESINARLAQLERNFSTCSDISSISRCTVRSVEPASSDYRARETGQGASPPPTCHRIVHSTPKCMEGFRGENHGILREIDTFLNRKSEHGRSRENRISLGASARLSEWVKSQPGDREPLISLSEIWGKDDTEDGSITLQEEKLRRQHCERAIQALQSKLLEYQQKIAVAIEVDKKKDAALQQHMEEHTKLKFEVHQLSRDIQTLENRKSEHVRELELENAALKSEKAYIDNEVRHVRDEVTNLQGKNQLLESKLAQLMRASNESADVYKKQIDELEVRLSNSFHNKGQLEEQLANLKSELATFKATANKTSKEQDLSAKRLELMQEELKLLQQQKHDVIEKYKDEKHRADTLYEEKRKLEEALTEFKRKEVNVLKELESQRISLKSYYQQQLEQVVAKKLVEFQSELDATEQNLRGGAKEREKILAERAIKQIEMINTKNEQEIALMQEKYSEEVELYRIQLANASKTIEELQEKLNSYKTRRADIASKLHSIMENQWQKALEVLTSPGASEKPNEFSVENLNQNRVDGVELRTSSTTCQDNPENECFETPTSSRNRKLKDRRTEERLQAYIELLLNRSPRDLDNLEELLHDIKHSSEQEQRTGKDTDTSQKIVGRRDQKPPWK